MRAFRFSLKGMLAAFVFVGFATAALLGKSAVWAHASLGLMWITLAVVIVGLIYRHQAARAFYVGAAIFGWGYLALWAMVVPWVETTGVYVNSDFARPRLVTDILLHALHGAIEREVRFASQMEAEDAGIPAGAHVDYLMPNVEANWTIVTGVATSPYAYPDGTARIYTGPVAYRLPVRQNFKLAGHALVTLCLALIGGFVARWFYVSSIECTTTIS